MSPLFDRYGVRVIALSKDTTEQAAAQKVRDELPFPLLSDPKLKVIEAFGLLHHKAIQFRSFRLFGIPMGYPNGFKTMAIPTTLIIDEEGIVRFIDQADDYRIRGDEARIREALRSVLVRFLRRSPHEK